MSNILIVDDSEIWRRLFKQVLSKESRRISEAESGEHAVELARTRRARSRRDGLRDAGAGRPANLATPARRCRASSKRRPSC